MSFIDREEARLIKASPYKAVELWGRQLGSYGYYIVSEQTKALQDNAPVDAVFQRHDPVQEKTIWVCVSDLNLEHKFRQDYEHFLKAQEPQGDKK